LYSFPDMIFSVYATPRNYSRNYLMFMNDDLCAWTILNTLWWGGRYPPQHGLSHGVACCRAFI